MAKKKKAARAIDKAVRRAIHRGVSEEVVERIVEKAVEGANDDKGAALQEGKKKSKTAESAKRKSAPTEAA